MFILARKLDGRWHYLDNRSGWQRSLQKATIYANERGAQRAVKRWSSADDVSIHEVELVS